MMLREGKKKIRQEKYISQQKQGQLLRNYFSPGLILCLMLLLLLNSVLAGCQGQNKKTQMEEAGGGSGAIKIVDDLGQTIVLSQPAKRIISLYSAHTENLFALGLENEIIGVSTTESYPAAALTKPVFDYRADPEKVMAAEPDLVIIRPFVKQSNPDFVKTLENAKIKVVCLYPEKFEQFDEYIGKLALLTGRQAEAQVKLEEFHQHLQQIMAKTAAVPVKRQVYFEATATEYRTVTLDSMPATLLKLAGAVNAAPDATQLKAGSSIAAYGTEKLLMQASVIDVYLSQKGPMNPGITVEAIKLRPGFNKLKAVQENRVYIVDEKLVSNPTFRLADGAEELARMIYPEVFEK